MADVTISQLIRGTPNNSALLPFSQSGNTLSVSPSALLQNVGNIGIGTSTPAATLDVNGSLFTRGYNYIESASLNITEATRTRLTNSSSGFLELGTSNATNSLFVSNLNVFQIINTAPTYGLRILKAGNLKIDIIQDIITSASTGYFYIEIYVNNVLKGLHLRKNTGGQWDSINAHQILRVNQNDVISFNFIANILTVDSANWSYYNFMFWSN